MFRNSIRGAMLVIAATQIGCGDNSAVSSKLDVVVGSDEQTIVLEEESGVPATYHNLFNGIGKLTGDCTAFHVGQGIVVTAGHCLQAPTIPSNTAQPCQALSIAWGYRYRQDPYLVSRCVEVVERKVEGDLDYAILKVDPAPAVAIPFDLRGQTAEGAELTLFGHPQGEPLHWSGMCKAHWDAASGFLQHQCDTKAGNSGSPVFDHAQQKVVGVHKGGEGEWNWATPLAKLPLADLVNESAEPVDENVLRHEGGAQFGPFANNEKRLLAAFTTLRGRAVSFTLETNTEEIYDVVKVVDGRGQFHTVSGVTRKEFKDLRTPVIVVLESDYANPSAMVKFDAVAFSSP